MGWKLKLGAGIVIFYILFALVAPYAVNRENVENWYSITYWTHNPRFAPPEWVNLFGRNLPATETIGAAEIGKDTYRITYEFHYSTIPDDMVILFKTPPTGTVTVNVTTPDGRTFTVYSGPPVELDFRKSPPVAQTIIQNSGMNFTADEKITLMVTGKVLNVIFSRREGNDWVPVRGTYVFTVSASSEPYLKVVGKVCCPMGTDALGRDLWSAFLWGARQTLELVFAISAVAVLLGLLLGLAGSLSGKSGSAVDFASRVSTMLPMIPLLIALIPILQKVSYYGSLSVPVWDFALVLGLLLFGRISRNVKTMALIEKSKEYARAARVLGGSEWWVTKHHVMRIVLPYALSEFILLSAKALALISILGFFRVIPGFNWGGLLAMVIQQRALYLGAWWMVLPIGTAIAVLAIGFVLIHLEMEERFIDPWLS